MAVRSPTKWECDFCGDEFKSEEAAEDHLKDEHADEVLDEEWPRYFSEV